MGQGMKYICKFYGGRFHGVTMSPEMAESMTEARSEDLSYLRHMGVCVHRAELDNKPEFPGYIGPMWDGTENGVAVLRYETQEIYDALSD